MSGLVFVSLEEPIISELSSHMIRSTSAPALATTLPVIQESIQIYHVAKLIYTCYNAF